MIDDADIAEIASIIQLAMAPAFLLVGIGAMLQLFSGRLVRVVDRSRILTQQHGDCMPERRQCIVRELRGLDRRMTVVNAAILMGVCGAITVSIVIAMLFITGLARIDLTIAISVGFILAMAFLMLGLCLFLYEVRLAERNIHIDRELLRMEE
ncbi:MAG: DUF2721 domain-containing protein [Pseudomonadota bacterium]